MASSREVDWRLLENLEARKRVDVLEASWALAQIFGVRTDEVGLLRVRGSALEFLFPTELRTAGSIPLSSSAVAARTANSRQPEMFNEFSQALHSSVFELAPLGSATRGDDNRPKRVHKMMSAAVLAQNGETLGVIQISRMSATRDSAGPDFTDTDLLNLQAAAQRVAPLFAKF
jgi:hypothetical protein